MPAYQLNTGSRIKHLGTFASIEDVKKLRFFKDHPAYINYVEEVVEKPVKRYNRWRVCFTEVSSVDLLASYSKEEAKEHCKRNSPNGKLILVPKYAYHESDGVIS